MLYLTCTTITSVGLAHYGVSRAKDWVSVDCGTTLNIPNFDIISRYFETLKRNFDKLRDSKSKYRVI